MNSGKKHATVVNRDAPTLANGQRDSSDPVWTNLLGLGGSGNHHQERRKDEKLTLGGVRDAINLGVLRLAENPGGGEKVGGGLQVDEAAGGEEWCGKKRQVSGTSISTTVCPFRLKRA